MLVESQPRAGGLFGLGWACLLAGTFFLPFVALVPERQGLLPGLDLTDWQRVFQAAFMVAGLLALSGAVLVKRGACLASPQLLASWTIVAALSLASALSAHYPLAALLDWAWLHALFALALLSAWIYAGTDKEWRDPWLAAVGIAGLLYVFWFFLSNTDFLFSYDFRFTETTFPGFGNSRYFSDFQAVLLFLAPLSVVRYVTARMRWAGCLLVGLLYMLAFVAEARSVLLGQLAAHSILLLAFGRSYWPLLRTYLGCWLLGWVLYMAIVVLYAPWSVSLGAPEMEVVAQPAVSQSVQQVMPQRFDGSGRGELFVKSLRLIRMSPWLGVGGRHFGCFLKEDYRVDYSRANGDAAHPHNAILQLAVEWGIGLAVVVLAATAWLLFGLIRTLRASATRLEAADQALLGALLALGGHAMVAGVLNGPVSQMLLVLLVGWSLGYKKAAPQGGGKGGWFVPLFAITLAIGILLLFSTELADLPASTQRYFDNYRVTDHMAPRFWAQGWLVPLCGKI